MYSRRGQDFGVAFQERLIVIILAPSYWEGEREGLRSSNGGSHKLQLAHNSSSARWEMLGLSGLHFTSQERRRAPSRPRNLLTTSTVFKQPLAIHSTRPMTGFMRTGYCEAPRADAGNHSVAGTYISPSCHLSSISLIHFSNRNIRVPRLLCCARQRFASGRPHGRM